MIGALLIALVRVLCGAQIRWLGVAPEARQRVYFANHRSNLDALVLWVALPPALRALTRPVAAHDYWHANALRRHLAADVLHAVLIERKKVTVSNNPLTALLAALDAGASLIIFPEGGRSPGPDMREFKSGLYHLARKRPDVEFVPVWLENLNRVLPKGEVLPVPMLGSITVGAPVALQAGESRDAYLARARDTLWELRLT